MDHEKWDDLAVNSNIRPIADLGWQARLRRRRLFAIQIHPPWPLKPTARIRLRCEDGVWSGCWTTDTADSATPEMKNAPARTRTLDPVIKSHLLYQLSYRGLVKRCRCYMRSVFTGNPYFRCALRFLVPTPILLRLNADSVDFMLETSGVSKGLSRVGVML